MSRLSPLPACAALDSLFPLWKHSRLFQTSSDRSVNRSTIRAEQRFANGTRGPSLESSNGRLVWAGQKPSISYSTRSAKAAQGLRQGHEKERPPRSPRRSLTPSARGTGGEEEEAIMNGIVPKSSPLFRRRRAHHGIRSTQSSYGLQF